MMTFADLLQPEHIQLHPKARTRDAAIQEIAALLNDSVQVLDGEELLAKVKLSAPCIMEQDADFCLCLPHARTEAVTAMVMSVGRFDRGLVIPDVEKPIRYIFCIAVPPEMATDYLRIIGLIARIAKDSRSEQQIYTAETAEDFIATMVRLEAKL